MRGFASCPLPVQVEGARLAVYMACRRRHAADPAHKLVRSLLARVAEKVGRSRAV
jgi:hypothetical protein